MNLDISSADCPRGVFAGLATVDIAYPVKGIPAPNQKVSTAVPEIAAGGPATNAAVTFAFLGGRSTLMTAVGQHALGSVIRQELERLNVSVHDFAAKQEGLPPVSSIFVLPNGDRSVVSANAKAFPELKVKTRTEWFDNARFVLIDGHYPVLCQEVAHQARAAGIDVVLDAGSWKEGTPELLPDTAIALCSNDFRPPGCQTTEDVYRFLSNCGVERIAITRGAESILYIDKGHKGEITVVPIKAVDTTAAGDVFHGAFCYQFSLNGDFRDALAFAAEVASFSCMNVGTRSWMKAFPR